MWAVSRAERNRCGGPIAMVTKATAIRSMITTVTPGSSKGSHDYYEEEKPDESHAASAPEPVNGDVTHDAPPSG